MLGTTLGVVSTCALRCGAHLDGSRARFRHWECGARCFWGVVLLLACAAQLDGRRCSGLVLGGDRNHQWDKPSAVVASGRRLHSRRSYRARAVVAGDPSCKSVAAAPVIRIALALLLVPLVWPWIAWPAINSAFRLLSDGPIGWHWDIANAMFNSRHLFTLAYALMILIFLPFIVLFRFARWSSFWVYLLAGAILGFAGPLLLQLFG